MQAEERCEEVNIPKCTVEGVRQKVERLVRPSLERRSAGGKAIGQESEVAIFEQRQQVQGRWIADSADEAGGTVGRCGRVAVVCSSVQEARQAGRGGRMGDELRDEGRGSESWGD